MHPHVSQCVSSFYCVDYSGSDSQCCSIILQGDHEKKTSISCETQNQMQNTFLSNNIFFLSGAYKNVEGIIESNDLKYINWIKSLKVRFLEFYNVVLFLPSPSTIFEDVHFYDSYIIHKTQETSKCHVSCLRCEFIRSTERNQSSFGALGIDIKECHSASIDFQTVTFLSTNFRITFLTSIEARLNDIVLSRNQNLTQSGSKFIFEQLIHKLPKESKIDISLNNPYCFDNEISKFQTLSAIITLKFKTGSISVNIENSVCFNSSKFLDYVLQGGREIFNPLIKYNKLHLQNVSLLSNKGLSNIIRIHFTVPGVINILNSIFNNNHISSGYDNFIDLDYKENPIPKTGVISINTTTVNITVINCNLNENYGRIGGALSVIARNEGNVIIEHCNFTNNGVSKTKFRDEGQGGALWIQTSTLTLEIKDCRFEGNTAHDSGGAVYIGSVTQVVTWLPDYKNVSQNKGDTAQPLRSIHASTIHSSTFHALAPVASPGPPDVYHYEGSGDNGGSAGNQGQESLWLVYCIKGIKGEKGDTGRPGDVGAAGPQGNPGPPGPAGYTGFPGPIGHSSPINIFSASRRNKRGIKDEKGDDGMPGSLEPTGFRDRRDYADFPGATVYRGPMGHIGQFSTSFRYLRKLSETYAGIAEFHGSKGIYASHGNLLNGIEEQGKDIEGHFTVYGSHRDKRNTDNIEFTECPQSVIGHPCVRGLKGRKGYPGFPGFRGPIGAIGFPGFQGVRGPPGKDGRAGTTKATAISGYPGIPGPPGPMEATRFPGFHGVRGPPGKDGPAGATKATGISGRKRREVPPGKQNLRYITSNSQCPPGDHGDRGITGMPGKQGPRGRQGAHGATGRQGLPGLPGDAGIRGLSGQAGTPVNIDPSIIDKLTNHPTVNTFKITIIDTLFKRNTVVVDKAHPNNLIWSEKYGGGICFGNLYGLLYFQMCGVTFVENESPMGGAIGISGYAKTIGNITQCVFHSNKVKSISVYNSETLQRFSGGAIYVFQEIYWLHIHNADFKGNEASSCGGAVFLFTSKISYGVTIRDTNFTENSAHGLMYGMGGAISLIRPDFTPTFDGTIHFVHVINCSFVNNKAENGAGIGNYINSFGHHSHLNLFLIDTNFTGNEAIGEGGGLFVVYEQGESPPGENNILSLTNVKFLNNTSNTKGAGLSVAVQSHSLDIILGDALFEENSASEQGAGISIIVKKNEQELLKPYNLNTTITNTMFIKNRLESSNQIEKGGAIYMDDSICKCYDSFLVLSHTMIIASKATRALGAGVYVNLPLQHSTIALRNTIFRENYAGNTGTGGAIFITGNIVICNYNVTCSRECSMPMNIIIDNVVFIDNIASKGGAMYLDSDIVEEGNTIIIRDSIFSCCSLGLENIAYNSSLLHSAFSGALYNVSFYHYSKRVSSLCSIPDVVFDKHQSEITLKAVNFFCENSRLFIDFDSPDGNNASGNITFKHFMSYCTECSSLSYVFGNGTEVITNENSAGFKKLSNLNHYHKAHDPCLPCPYGGECFGRLKARPNFWGYKDKAGQVFFATCPQGYCCNNIEVICEEYNTCALHREGRLCGRCRHGYTESLMSRTCVRSTECNGWWVFASAIFVAVTYLMWYTYKGEIVPFIECVILKINLFKTRNDHVVNVQEKKGSQSISKMYTYGESEITSRPPEIKQTKLKKGYFGILVYFTNILSLLKVTVEFKSASTGKGVLYSIEKYVTRYLDIDMQRMANITVCPFPNMSAVEKSLARPGFVFLILIMWFVFYAIASLLEGTSMTWPKCKVLKIFRSFQMQLIEGYVEIVKYSYSGLAGATFLLLTCVQIGDNLYWKYDANIECFSTWQHAVIIFATVYTVPFSLSTIVGVKLLQRQLIGYRQFMLGCLFPLPFLLFWILIYGIRRRPISTIELNLKGVKPNSSQHKIEESSKRILESFQGPYTNGYSSWEGVIELRKLLFNTYYLIENNIYRLGCCTITAVIILMHHNFARPFNNKNSNIAESLSLALLCIACITNGIKTVFTETGILVEPNTPTEQLLFLMNRLDRILFLILIGYIILSEAYFMLKEFKSKKGNNRIS